ncbi:conserved hypothetical protein [Paraburkholderia unamae]|uniref:DUF6734 family protein n=1 Tax=Paraburkholderia unamae TaxID=219649 RepID=UPI001CAC42D1|nr:DUF6734 family protein [Paraburkholderia unamae]CAG9244922.1 conserved hypothetical protein [Paraburkholderia unamae]
MRAVWSFWSKPYLAGRGGVWRAPHHHLLAWALSLRVARAHYPDTALVTDTAGKAILVDHLGLSFSQVSTELDALRDEDAGWWALGKLYAYSVQDAPFVHIDSDVFLWKPLPRNMTDAPVFAQCPELHPPLDTWSPPCDIEAAFAKHGLSLPVEWEWARSFGSEVYREENCGVVGGQDVGFLRHYAHSALRLVRDPAHRRAWCEIPCKDGYNMRVEQMMLAACVDYHRSHPGSPWHGVRIRYLFPDFAGAFDPARAAQAGYTHLLGDSKRNAAVAQRLEQRVRGEDRDCYERCVRLGARLAQGAFA